MALARHSRALYVIVNCWLCSIFCCFYFSGCVRVRVCVYGVPLWGMIIIRSLIIHSLQGEMKYEKNPITINQYSSTWFKLFSENQQMLEFTTEINKFVQQVNRMLRKADNSDTFAIFNRKHLRRLRLYHITHMSYAYGVCYTAVLFYMEKNHSY